MLENFYVIKTANAIEFKLNSYIYCTVQLYADTAVFG
jgi:hypothetical protein